MKYYVIELLTCLDGYEFKQQYLYRGNYVEDFVKEYIEEDDLRVYLEGIHEIDKKEYKILSIHLDELL